MTLLVQERPCYHCDVTMQVSPCYHCDVTGAGAPCYHCVTLLVQLCPCYHCDVTGAGVPMKITIIDDGKVTPYIKEPGLSDQILIPPEVDTVNLTWQAGHETVSGSIFFCFLLLCVLFSSSCSRCSSFRLF